MNRTAQKTRLMAVFALISLVAAPMLAAGGGLAVKDSTTVGDTVLVRVANLGPSTESGVLSVTAVVDGTPVTAMRTVTVAGFGADCAAVRFSAPVDFVLVARMSDDGNPI